jgi:GntR family transcriptional regulator
MPKRKRDLTFKPLDKNSFTPMYFQIQAQLLKMIQSRRLAPGEMVPGEEELTRIYGVSRMTFVSQPKVEKDIAHLLGFSAEMRALGRKSSSRVLVFETVAAPPEISARLEIEARAMAFHLRRVRSVERVPVAIEEVWLAQQQFPGLKKVNFARHSLYDTLQKKYGVRIGAADEVIEARLANKQEAALLKITPRSSLLVISRTLLTVQGKPVETGRSLYRADRYRAVLHIPAKNIS